MKKISLITAIVLAASMVASMAVTASAADLQFKAEPQFRAWDSEETGVLLQDTFDGNGDNSQLASGVTTLKPQPNQDTKENPDYPDDSSYYSDKELPYAWALYEDSTYTDASGVYSSGWYWNGTSALSWNHDVKGISGIRTKFMPLKAGEEVYAHWLFGTNVAKETYEGPKEYKIGASIEFWDKDLKKLGEEKLEIAIGGSVTYAGQNPEGRPTMITTSPANTAYVTMFFFINGDKGAHCAFDTLMLKLNSSAVGVNSPEAFATMCSAAKAADDAVAKAYWDAHPKEEPKEEEPEKPAENPTTGDPITVAAIVAVASLAGASVIRKRK
ncbi:MAG: hypothetical protein E7665_10825 [Ruminococcaceae bacterium]|nr:hypothetical protein [Oscillospiraceae bacterium]